MMKLTKMLAVFLLLCAGICGTNSNAAAQYFPSPYYPHGTTLPGLHQGMSGILNMNLYNSKHKNTTNRAGTADDGFAKGTPRAFLKFLFALTLATAFAVIVVVFIMLISPFFRKHS